MRTADEIHADAVDQRPFSNSTDFEYWAGGGRGCYDCLNDDLGVGGDEKYCPILGLAITGMWPREWQRRTVESKYGNYEAVGECSEFEERRDDGPDEEAPKPPPPPAPEIVGQIDMFEVFADRIADEASQPTEAVAR